MPSLQFYLLITSAGTWNNENLFNYNVVYPSESRLKIQYFSNENANDFYGQHGRRVLGSLDYRNLPFMPMGDPSGNYRADTHEKFMNPYFVFTKLLIDESHKPNLKSELASNSRSCLEELKSASRNGPIGISKIIDGHLARCKVIQLIGLIQSRYVRIVRSETYCGNDLPGLCIVEDKRVEAKSVRDELQPIAAVRQKKRNAYLVTVEGILKIMLQKSADEYIIIPKLGALPTNDIYNFLAWFPFRRKVADVSNLESASINLFSSTTDEAANIFDNFIGIS